MKAIIFGVNGQDGFYLKELLDEKGIECIGIARSPGNWLQGDVAEYSFVEDLISSNKPDLIFHLAAKSTTRHDALFENHACISTGTLNILEAVRKHSRKSKVFITGSGVQFKNSGYPISENDEFEASSPYSIARIQSVYAVRYFRKLGIQAYVGYLFHHESPLRKDNHVSKIIVNAVNDIKKGNQVRINLGDISVRKEWAFAKDIVKGIFTLIEQDEFFEATIGTGIPYSIEDWLDICFGEIGKKWSDYVTLKQDFKAEYPILYSNPGTINKCGWYAETDFKNLSKIMIG